MPNVLVRDLPKDFHAELQRRAEVRGPSLQQDLAWESKRITDERLRDEVFARSSGRRGGRVGVEQAVEDLAAERGER